MRWQVARNQGLSEIRRLGLPHTDGKQTSTDEPKGGELRWGAVRLWAAMESSNKLRELRGDEASFLTHACFRRALQIIVGKYPEQGTRVELIHGRPSQLAGGSKQDISEPQCSRTHSNHGDIPNSTAKTSKTRHFLFNVKVWII